MELSELATQIFHGQTLADKLVALPGTLGDLTDAVIEQVDDHLEALGLHRGRQAPSTGRVQVVHTAQVDRHPVAVRTKALDERPVAITIGVEHLLAARVAHGDPVERRLLDRIRARGTGLLRGTVAGHPVLAGHQRIPLDGAVGAATNVGAA